MYLRNYRTLMLNILLVMVDAKIPNLPFESYQKVLQKMEERFLPGLSNEEARAKFEEIINISVSASMAEFFEGVHRMAAMFK